MTRCRISSCGWVAEIPNTSDSQIYALVRSGDLPAIKIGGRGQWRVEVAQPEAFIERMYAEKRAFVADESPTASDGASA